MPTPFARIRIDGDLNQEALDRLRSALRLQPQGRLGDDWDQIFGDRREEVAGGHIHVLLNRTDTGGPWTLFVDGDPTLTQAVVESVVDEIVTASGMAGIRISRVAVPTDHDWASFA